MQSVLLPRYHPLDIFAFGRDRQVAGERIVLIIVEAVSGASVRPVGTPMIVSEAGDYAGYVSNGCVDADIAGHALEALKTGEARRVSYGPDSPYLDIRLPCGGGVSLVIFPEPDAEIIANICAKLEAREAVSLSCETKLKLGGHLLYAPPLRVIAAGRGEHLLMFTRAAGSLGIDVIAYSPDNSDISVLQNVGAEVHGLTFGTAPEWSLDSRTAIVTLFHDHDYELPLLISALKSDAFYVGAMGSRQTHEKRLAALKEKSPDLDLSRLRGPIGLVPSMRDAGRLAISVLAEIIAEEGAPF
jgi:xanthine dehydrogenase accessory factor